jgi:hypothetical protein
LIRQWQNQHIIEIGTTLVVPFNIFIDAQFQRVKIVGDKATLQSSGVGLGRFIKKFDVLLIEEEWKMLLQSICQPTSPIGLNLKFGYFCIRNFFIQGCSKLSNVDFEDFSLVQPLTRMVL